MKRVIIESPYAGNLERNIHYLSRCLRHSLLSGEAPFASHALYTRIGVLDDSSPSERDIGLLAGWAWMHAAHLVAVYTDLGISPGMKAGIEKAEQNGFPVEFRSLPGGMW